MMMKKASSTTMKKKKSKQSPLKVISFFLLLGIALYLIGDPLHPTVKVASLRSRNALQNDDDDDTSVEKEETPTKKSVINNNKVDEGRIFTFELGNLVDESNGGSTSGTVTIRTRPSWAPLGVEQFHKLVDQGFYDGCRFFRVVPNFVVQFGINGDPQIQSKARKMVIQDDPVKKSNDRGTVTFATSGPNTRTSQLFINIGKNGNKHLDGMGFSPFAEVIDGMENVDRINSEYREKPGQGQIQNKGNEYLNKNFPRLSFISKVEEKKSEIA